MSEIDNQDKQNREVARCVRTLLKARGQKASIKEIVPMLEGKDLSDPVALTHNISQELANRPNHVGIASTTNEPKVSRGQIIGDWFVQNYDIIRACPEVEEGLLHLVSRGRVSKDEQLRRRVALIARATGEDAVVDEVVEESTSVVNVKESDTVTEVSENPSIEYNF